MSGKITTRLRDALAQVFPTKNTLDNANLSDVVGNKTDSSFGGYTVHPSIIGHLKASYYHAHGKSFTLPINAPVVIAPSATAWEYGTPVEIGVFATSVYDVHWVQVSGMANSGNYNIELCNADASVVYGKTACFRDTNFVQGGNVPIQVPPIPKDTVIYARLASSTANAAHTIAIKLFCHPYNDLTD